MGNVDDEHKRARKTERDLFKVMTHGTALSFGLLTAFLYSLEDVAHNATLVFSFGTVVAFVFGWIAGWLFWRGVRHLSEKNRR